MIAEAARSFGNKNSRNLNISLEGLPPIHSPEAERCVLGAMLSDPDAVIDEVAQVLRAEDFFNPAHQSLFNCIIDMRNRALPIDPGTVLQYLEDRKIAASIGGAPLLGELAAGVVSILTSPAHTETVRAKSILRALQSACAKIVFNTQERQHEVTEVLDEAEKGIFEIADRAITTSTISAREAVKLSTLSINRAVTMKGRYDGLATGFTELDQLTTGFKPGEMIVIAARPGVGKTAFALTMARNFLKERWNEELGRFTKPGYGVGFFSLEMTAEQLMLRLIASTAKVSLQSIRKGELSNGELDGISMISEEVAKLPLFIDESSMLSITQLRAKARRLKQRNNIDVIIIDYLQLLTSSSEKAKDNRQVEVAEISRGIKALAKELKIPIIVLAQLNRKSEEGNSEPALHHLRESGSIEQDADTVMLLSRAFEKEDDDEGVRGLKATINIAKQRSGPVGKVQLRFLGQYTLFEDEPRDAR
ncbi:MAG: replicative DNA helicase [Blastochloris sp.]|nr:replicative DNA helicase [Blastochloris sp.]